MGRNTPSLRMEIERIVEELRKTEKIMRPEDGRILENLIKKGKVHTPESSYAAIDPQFSFLISILIEILKENNDH